MYEYVLISESQFLSCTISSEPSQLLETKCSNCSISSAWSSFLQRIQAGCKSCMTRAIWLFFLADRKWLFYETKLKKSIEIWHSFSKWPFWNKRKRLHKKRVQLSQDWLGTPTWPPFHCFGTPIWTPWRHVKRLSLLIMKISQSARKKRYNYCKKLPYKKSACLTVGKRGKS